MIKRQRSRRSAPSGSRPSPVASRIGLLGGSFNPAHAGHLHISRLAIEHLALHELWWLVSPQNPLKPVVGMAPFPARFAAARRVARHPRIRVTAIERDLGTRYTVDTVRALKARHPEAHFVLVIGADNLLQLPAWHAWEQLFQELPVAIFDRPSYSQRALGGVAALRFAGWRLDQAFGPQLAYRAPPAWIFFRTALHPASATALRRRETAHERRAKLRELKTPRLPGRRAP
ncbi:MAG: nicotinate-nucleotide adenylyltransferase [Alphaproteobacteria bacterium]